jgi:hypothetical protein
MNRKIKRKSNEIKIVAAPSLAGTAWCPNCNEKLRPIKGDTINLKCWDCGELVPIRTVKFDTILSKMDTEPSTVVQNKKAKRGIRVRPKDPLTIELEGRGMQVLESDWRDQKL